MLQRVSSTARLRPKLHIAVEKGDLKRVKKLINRRLKKCNIDEVDDEGYVALHHAIRSGHFAVFQYLLDKGANTEVKDRETWTLLHYAASLGDHEVLKVLLRTYSGTAKRSEERKSFRKSITAAFMSKKAKDILESANEADVFPQRIGVDAIDVGRNTSLHVATRFGHEKAILVLLGRYADIEAKNIDKRTPLHIATHKQDIAIVKLLIENSANLNATENYNNTALHAAVAKENQAIVELLIASGASKSPVNDYGHTPVHVAVKAGSYTMTKLLLGLKADVNTVGNVTSPLHIAAEEGHEEITKLLLENGANVNALNDKNRTPLHCASMKGNIAIVNLLLGQSNIDALDTDGKTAVSLAVTGNHEQVSEVLLGRNHIEKSTQVSYVDDLVRMRNETTNKNIILLINSFIQSAQEQEKQIQRRQTEELETLRQEELEREHVENIKLEREERMEKIKYEEMEREMRENEQNIRQDELAREKERLERIEDQKRKDDEELEQIRQSEMIEMARRQKEIEEEKIRQREEAIAREIEEEKARRQAETEKQKEQEIADQRAKECESFSVEHATRENVSPTPETLPELTPRAHPDSNPVSTPCEYVQSTPEASPQATPREHSPQSTPREEISPEAIEPEPPTSVPIPTTTRRRLALLIGNAKYVHAGELNNPTRDVKLIAQKLEQVNFEVTTVCDAKTHHDMEDPVKQFSARLSELGDQVDCCLFYYAGHGLQTQGRNYLVPTQIDITCETDILRKCAELGSMIDAINECSNEKTVQIVIVDACRAEYQAPAWRSITRDLPPPGLVRVSPPSGCFALFSTAAGTKAFDTCKESEECSPFALALSRVLHPEIELSKLAKEVTKDVKRMTNRRQTPYNSSDLDDDFFF